MIIEPNGNVYLCENVPLDSGYRNTLYFVDYTAQLNYFVSKSPKGLHYKEQSYTRVSTGKIRLQAKIGDIYKCNYMVFSNNLFTNDRRFYAFITNIEYVNNITCDISFEIDVIQTYMWDFELKDSFIERQHSTTDSAGDNLVAENLEIGEYVFSGHKAAGVSNGSAIYIASTVDKNGKDVDGGYYGGLYSGVEIHEFATADDANAYIKALTVLNKSDAIVSVFQANPNFMNSKGEPPATTEIAIPKALSNIDGYVPKNKKLFIYPYNFIYCTNLMGQTAEFKYEYMDGGNTGFICGLIGETSCNPQVTLIPKNYKIDNLGNLNEKMVVNGFPQCAYNIDTFKAWLAQNGASTAISVIGSAGAMVAGVASAPATGGLSMSGAISGATNIASTMAQFKANSAKPPQANGTPGSGGLFAFGQLDFHFYNAQITAQYAKQIDDYFTMFGYAQHIVATPNIHARPHYTYVKTVDCNVVGTCPSDDLQKISSIFDKGITWWVNPNEVGNYSVDNRP